MVNLSKEELDFLIELQHEMLTQDHVGQAAPRYWAIETERTNPTSIDYCEGLEVFDDTACETVATDMESFIEYINDTYWEEGIKAYYNNGDALLVVFQREADDEDTLDSLMQDGEITGIDKNGEDVEFYDYLSIEELVSELNKQPYVTSEYRVVYTRQEHIIAPNTLFLTNRAAKQHLKENRHNYDRNAHTYAMTAWRSPEVEQLWNILDKINWQELKEKKYGKDNGELCGQQ